jgi:CHAT domain-containing protein/tetratricopeptide (TPR) repeat protein
LKTAALLACCLLLFPLVGTVRRSVPNARGQTLVPAPEVSARQEYFQDLLQKGRNSYAAGQYIEAGNFFEALRHAALPAREFRLAARATGNLGGCQFALHQYQPALASFLEARRLAALAGDTSAIAAFDANIASLYSETGELESAAQLMQGSLARMSGSDRTAHLPELLIQMATIRARQGRMAEASGLFRQGIDLADRAGNLELFALGWNRWGEELLKRGDLASAELALLEAFRVRKLNRLPLDSSYRNLGRLRMAQGDLRSASALLDRAVELSARPQGLMPTWDIYHSRGLARLAQNRLPEAMRDLRVAMRLARAWRWSAPAGDAARIGAEGWLHGVHSALIEAGNRLYLKTHDAALVRETFEAAEENRSSSLRALLERGDAAQLPAAYWEALNRLQRAEIQALRGGSRGAAGGARAEIDRMEASLAPAWAPPAGGVLSRAQASLGRDTALLSFELGEHTSWLYALDRAGLALYPLPPRVEIEREAAAAKDAIRDGNAQAPTATARLYNTLFGDLEPRFRRKPRWLLSLDDALFEVPFAALAVEQAPRAVYLVERHAIEAIPGAACWVQSASRQSGSKRHSAFLGIGDPVYNAADPRAGNRYRRTRRVPGAPRLFAFTAFAAGPDRRAETSQTVLPRLVGSSAELEACTRAWNGEHVLLEGVEASRRNVVEQLGREPAVAHFATHVLESAGGRASGLIALSLAPGGEPELLAPEEIARWRIHTGLVVLSGCRSGAGAVLPGTGLIGLTRAWLAAGARAVIGSRWDTPDDDGTLFGVLYRTLGAQPGASPGQSLRAAQLAMIRSGGWRANPRYWGAYFVTGTDFVTGTE